MWKRRTSAGTTGIWKARFGAIELIDELVVGPLLEGLAAAGEDYSILVMPDHPTPLAIKTHISDPVPYLLYRSTEEVDSGIERYTENTAKSTGRYVEQGQRLMEKLLDVRRIRR